MNYPNSAENFKEFLDFLWFDFRNLFPEWISYPIRSYRHRKRVREFPPGTYVEDCGYWPCIIVENNDGDLTVWNMAKGHLSGCSLFHCGVVKLTRNEALNRKKVYEEQGVSAMAQIGIDRDEQLETNK